MNTNPYQQSGQGQNTWLPSQTPQNCPPQYYPTDPYIATQLNTLSFGQGNLNQQFNVLCGQVDHTLRALQKQRRRLTDQSIVFSSDGRIQLQKTYSDGLSDWTLLITNAREQPEITVISLGDSSFYFIVFKKANILITGNALHIRSKDLYEAFTIGGVSFNPSLSVSVIEKALYQEYAPKISNCERTARRSGLAGWEDGTFFCAESYWYLERFKLKLPVLNKSFNKDHPAHFQIIDYMNSVKQIQDLKTRVLFSLLPMAAILNSLLREWQLIIPFAINLVLMTDTVSMLDIAAYLQVFSREKLEVHSLDATTNHIWKTVKEAKDEVLLFAGIGSSSQTYYHNKKIEKNLYMLAENAVSLNGTSCGGVSFQALLTLISSQMILLKGVKNVFIDKGTILREEGCYDNKQLLHSVNAVLALFVRYVEEHMEGVKQLMNRNYNAKSREEKYWRIILAIANDFWSSGNCCSLSKVLCLSENFAFDFLWTDESPDYDNGIELLVSAVRRMMPEIVVTHKSSKNFSAANFVYDEANVWIMTELLDEIFVQNGIIANKNFILLQCKERDFLKTDQYGGYSTRLQTAKIRKEYYRFQRDGFSHTGQPDIIDLAKRRI